MSAHPAEVEPFRRVPGQTRAVAILRGAVRRGEIGHAWAFVGPAGVGQREVARALAAALNCERSPTGCGTCSACERSLRGIHPALHEFQRTGAAHRVDDVRETWLPVAFRTVGEGRFKVLRIVAAERMNEVAANAFLKALEEPPERTVWILDVADPDELPDTILSRCRMLRFCGWGPQQLNAHAERLGLRGAAERDLAVRACMGSPRALERLAAPGGLDDLRAHRRILGRLRAEGPGCALVTAKALDESVRRAVSDRRAAGKAELAALAEVYGDQTPRAVTAQAEARLVRDEREVKTAVVQAAMDDLTAWLRDCLLVACGGRTEDAIHRDAAAELRADAVALGPGRLLAAADLVHQVREDLELNAQPQLAVEALLLSLHGLGHH